MADEKILVIDDEEVFCSLLKRTLSADGYSVETSTGISSLDILTGKHYDLVMTDLKMPNISGLEILTKVKEVSPDTDVIIMTGFATIESAIEAIKVGAYDYISKPFEIEYLRQRVKKCLESRKLKNEVSELKALITLYEINRTMSTSTGLKQLLDMIVESVCKVLAGDTSSIMLLDQNTNELYVESFFRQNKLSECEKNEKFKVAGEIGKLVIRGKKPLLLINGLQKYPELAHLENRPGIRSSILAPLIVKDKVIGVISLCTRNSDRKDFTEKDLKLLTLFANHTALAIHDAQVYEKIKELDKLKTEFVSNVSHELRTPLMSMQGSLELLLDNFGVGLDDENKTLLDIMHKNVLRMGSLVQDIMDFTKIEAGLFEIRKTKFYPLDILEEAVKEMKFIAYKKSIDLKKEILGAIPNINADPDRIKQVLFNLIGNAIKFTPEKGEIIVKLVTCINASNATNAAKGINEDEFLQFSVIDNGIGITPEDTKRVFDKFYQVDGSSTREKGGTGLGLTISKKIVEAHGGEISVESPPEPGGKGSAFKFTLPVNKE